MKFAINAHMVQLALALACTLFLEPVSGRAVIGSQSRRDLSAGDDHGHGHNHEITATGGYARRDFDSHHDGQDDHDHILGIINKRAPVPPKKSAPKKTAPNRKQAPLRTQPKKQPLRKTTQQTKKKQTQKLPKPKTDPKKKPPQQVTKPKTDPKAKPPCGGTGTTAPGQKKPKVPKKKTGIRSLWETLTRRSSTDTTIPTTSDPDSCPVPGPSTIFKADCGVDLNVAALGFEENNEENAQTVPADDESDLTSDFENLGLEEFFKLEDFPTNEFGTETLEGQCVTDRKRQRAVNFKCSDSTGQYSYSWPVWPHPTPNDFFTKPQCNNKHKGWYVDTAKAAGVASCVDSTMMSKAGKWGLVNKAIIVPPGEPVTDYHTEHVYELNFLGNYFKYLNEEKKVTCEVLDKYLFRKSRAITTKMPRGAEKRLVYLLINELGSEMNMGRLAVLDGSVNTLKYNILARRIKNPVNLVKFKASSLNTKMTAFRRMSMVMEYLTMTRAILMGTKDAIETNLAKFDTALGKLTPSPLPAGVNLKAAHHEFISDIIKEGNTKAKNALSIMLQEIIADADFKKLDAKVQKTFNDFKTGGARTYLTSLEEPLA